MPWRSDSRHRRLSLQALLEQARLATWRLWARDAAIEKKGVLKGPRLRLERRRVWATKVLVPRCVGRREGRRGSLAPRKCDGAGSSRGMLRITAQDRHSDRCEPEQVPTIAPGLPLVKISTLIQALTPSHPGALSRLA
jgi:hypothetical protein